LAFLSAIPIRAKIRGKSLKLTRRYRGPHAGHQMLKISDIMPTQNHCPKQFT